MYGLQTRPQQGSPAVPVPVPVPVLVPVPVSVRRGESGPPGRTALNGRFPLKTFGTKSTRDRGLGRSCPCPPPRPAPAAGRRPPGDGGGSARTGDRDRGGRGVGPPAGALLGFTSPPRSGRLKRGSDTGTRRASPGVSRDGTRWGGR